MTPELPAVSYRRLIRYLDSQLVPIRERVESIDKRMDDHDAWHRGRLESEVETLRLARTAHIQQLVSTVSSIAAVISVIVAIIVYASN